MQKSYTLTRAEPLLRRARITYYVYRDDEQHCVLVAEASDATLEQKLQLLEEARVKFFNSIGLKGILRCLYSKCTGARQCQWLNVFPHIQASSHESRYHYELTYDCFDLEKMIYAKDIVGKYYVGLTTFLRVTASLAMMVDWLIRAQIVVRISVENLLIDLDTALVTIIDWSSAKITRTMPPELTIIYYRQLVQVVLRLANVKNHDGEWIAPNEYQVDEVLKFFDYLQKFRVQKYLLPSDLGAAADYVRELTEARGEFLKRLNCLSQRIEFRTEEPLYRIYRKSEN